MKPREILTWKFLVYQGILPLLKCLGPKTADAILGMAARVFVRLNPSYRRKLADALARVKVESDAAADLAIGELRFLGRDYLLEGKSAEECLAEFDVEGDQAFIEALKEGRGAVLVGSHFGAHISALHWFYQKAVSLRIMVQRPKHISKTLSTFFDRVEPEPQSEFFLRRGLAGSDCVRRLLQARNALKSGKAVYLAGDVPWQGGNTRAGQLLGKTFRFLSVWADLAAVTHSPVFLVFCSHQAGGRFSLKIEPFGQIQSGTETAAVARYLERLDSEILKHPNDAVAHLLWPCFGASKPSTKMTSESTFRPSRRASPIPVP